MAIKEKIDLTSLDLVPLADKKLPKGIFPDPDEKFQHLIDWLKTRAIHAQREKKSRTYLAIYHGEVVAYLTVSTGVLKSVEGVKSTSAFNHQILIIGKLYVHPAYRRNGIGVKLLSFIVDMAHDLDKMTGCLGIQVDSNADKGTVEFYKNFGFIELPTENEKGEDEETIPMFFVLPSLTTES